MPGRSVEGESFVEVFWPGVVQYFVSMGEEFEGDSLFDWEPVQVFQLVCDVAVAGDVQDETCRGVLDALQPLVEFGRGSCVEGTAVVQFAAYEAWVTVLMVSVGDVSEWGHVDIEEGRAEGRTLGYAADDFVGLRAEWGKADSLGSAGEKGDDPVRGSVADSSIAEA
ncbi:hypothetical protein NDU88_002162 [Pleurodeles waltl]|uniref:Uncharacterized protein n=1 Tax=Pleurodeles waltl TaxID=8319 RepID=A0AAV7WMW7_PLEWA|nr:hypothetical protein NDU88_002162 [Pleurodeles waltl]